MKLWMIALVLGLFAIGSVIALATSTETVKAEEPKQLECSSCGNSCSVDSNCGLDTCNAVTGGSCGCGK